ncbi:MAG: response regulator [Magnetospirillum sp.]|nr:response regulator [Magnetospirillum sp.]
MENLPNHRSPAVLVIEDEPLIAMGLKLVLENMGCVVPAVVDNRADAVAAAERQDFDLILADVRLKGGDDGIAAVDDILHRRAVPVLFVTGNVGELDRRGIDRSIVLPKPFLPAALERAVRRVLTVT